MLHCASKAVVVRPLAFDAGVLPDSGTGVGVAQIHGVVCEPSSTGPPIGWLVITRRAARPPWLRSEEHTSELQSLRHLVCRLLLEKKKKNQIHILIKTKKKKKKKT